MDGVSTVNHSLDKELVSGTESGIACDQPIRPFINHFKAIFLVKQGYIHSAAVWGVVVHHPLVKRLERWPTDQIQEYTFVFHFRNAQGHEATVLFGNL